MGLAEELAELAQAGPIVVRDGRTTGWQWWVTDFIWRREVVDEAEIAEIRGKLGLVPAYPQYALPVVPYTIIQRIPLAS